jgi:hypothetical protein
MATPFPFTAAQTLTAAQMNAITTLPVSTKTASYVLTISDLGTRVVMNSASPTTITVNTSIFGASDKVEILNIGAGVCTVTAGTCTVGTTGNLALAQNAGGTLTFISASASVFTSGDVAVAAASSGLTCVKAETAFTTASSVTADSVFTSTYTNYILMFNYTTSTTNFPSLKLRVGGVSASTNYTSQQIQGFTSTVSTNARSAASDFSFAYYGNGTRESAVVNIMGPQLAQATQFVVGSGGLGGALVQNIYGLHTTATAYDGIEILVPSGTMTGTYAIYGFSKAV